MKIELTTLSFIIFCLAIWRISSLFANEDGPFHVFKKFRELCRQLSESNFFCKVFHLYEGIQCEWCNSIWFAFPISWVLFDLNIFNSFIVPLAASTSVIFLKYIREAIERSNRVVRKEPK